MNNLTTRKIVLGLLMTLVLAFSVQDIADAIDEPFVRSSGDLGRAFSGQTFTVEFTISLVDAANIANANGLQIDEDNNRINSLAYKIAVVGTTTYRISAAARGIRGYRARLSTETTDPTYRSAAGSYVEENTRNVVDSGGRPVFTDTSLATSTRATADPDDPVPQGKRQHYNEEAVTISVSGARATITSVSDATNTHSNLSTTSHTIKEGGSGNAELDADATTITVMCTTTSYGEVTITISDATPNADLPNGSSDKQSNLSSTVYVVRIHEQIPGSANVRLLNVTNGVGHGFYTSPVRIYGGDGSYYPVRYSITGSGSLYVRESNRNGTAVTTGTSLMTSTGAEVYMLMDGTSNTVTAMVDTSLEDSKGVYIYGRPQIDAEEQSVGPFSPGTLLTGTTNALTASITDSATTSVGVAEVPVKFEVENKGATGGTLFPTTNTTIVDSRNVEIKNPTPGNILYVRTAGTTGTATVDFQLGTGSGEQVITASALGLTKTIKVSTTTSPTTRKLSIQSNQSRSGSPNIFDLVALVENDGEPEPNVWVTFTTTKGLLTSTPSGRTGIDHDGDSTTAAIDDDDDPETSKDVQDLTDAQGEAEVIYNAGDSPNAEVVASISVIDDNNRVIDLQDVVFNIRGGTRRPSPPSGPSEPSNAITITLSSTTGEPGDEIDVTVTSDPTGVLVNLNSGELDDTDFSRLSGGTPFTSVLVLPDEEDTYTFSATRSGFTSDSATVTVEAGILGTLSITAIGARSDGTQSFDITVRDTDGDRISGALTVRLSGSGFTTRNVETVNGLGSARVTLPTRAATYTLTVSADEYTSGSATVRVAAAGQQEAPAEEEEEEEEEAPTAAEPDSVSIVGPSTRSGTVNEELDAVLIVRVLDDDGDAVEDARVIFRVVSGRGRLSDRGNGRAIGVVTDSSGYARANFTPTDGGSHTVRASATGVTRTVEFTITTGSASGARDPGTGGTPGTVSPVVHVAAASRPPMLWVDGGAIYALVDADVKEFAPSVDNALNIAVGGGKVYWTEKTGENSGTINSADLDGTDVRELVSVRSVPMGIAVDTAGSKLYWTASSGKIKRANLDGSGSENVMLDLPSPMDIALAGGNAYWTQGNGSVRFVNLRGRKVVLDISTGSDTPGSLAIGGGKVYWTEKTAASAGTINSANLNGRGATQLTSIRSVPMGIAVDTARSKLYWTASSGKVKQANLNGSGAKNVVSGLGSPSDMVLSNSIATPTATPTTPKSTTTASKYDLNSDGAVDNADAALVADAMGTSNTKYDVNGDGTVNFLDLLLVFDNRDPGAAGAPTIVGMKLSAAQIDRIEEQIDLLIATNDRSPSAMRVLVYLQQLLVTARPEKTQLLANYPNPFNPETWIPYELATDTNVKITIYNTQGVVIRSLEFGHQSAGYYVGRDRAAYWDGRNALGEQVASGLYFYQLETDEMSSMRKMVILK